MTTVLSVFVFRCCLCVVCSEKEAFSLVALNPGGCCGIQPHRVVDHETDGARDARQPSPAWSPFGDGSDEPIFLRAEK